MAVSSGLLVKIRGDGRAFAAVAKSLAPDKKIEPILRVPARRGDSARELAARQSSTWLRLQLAGAENLWDKAHELLASGQSFAAGERIEAVEPDLVQQWIYKEGSDDLGPMAAAGDKKEFCAFDEQDGKGGKAKGSGNAWNFGDDFSELAKARGQVGTKLENILVAHLDTGFDPNHVTLNFGQLTARKHTSVAGALAQSTAQALR